MEKQYGVKTHLLLREKNSTDRYILLMQKNSNNFECILKQ